MLRMRPGRIPDRTFFVICHKGTCSMRRLSLATAALAIVATYSSASAYEVIDPLTHQPIATYQDDARAKATAIPRETVNYTGPYGAGTIVISTAERRLYYVL